MTDCGGVVTMSQNAFKMNMFYRRLWSIMQNYFIKPRRKNLNSIKQLTVHSFTLAIKCIGEDGDLKNESGRGRLWKGMDKDRLFFHNAFLDKWNRHMKKLGYPFRMKPWALLNLEHASRVRAMEWVYQ
jgi:hypothetical protein